MRGVLPQYEAISTRFLRHENCVKYTRQSGSEGEALEKNNGKIFREFTKKSREPHSKPQDL